MLEVKIYLKFLLQSTGQVHFFNSFNFKIGHELIGYAFRLNKVTYTSALPSAARLFLFVRTSILTCSTFSTNRESYCTTTFPTCRLSFNSKSIISLDKKTGVIKKSRLIEILNNWRTKSISNSQYFGN